MDGEAKRRRETQDLISQEMKTFNIAAIPQLHFGAGKITVLPSVAQSFGKNILIVRGGRSFETNSALQNVISQLGDSVHFYTILNEPSPGDIDKAVAQFCDKNIQVVAAVGGGSVLDAGKAISAMLPVREPVKDFLEGVGTKTHNGKKIPFIAIPTTSGTGSESTKNAVLSEVGPGGFKKSLRHNNFVPDHAILDPALTSSTPGSVTAYTGMDAFTQLLEAYLSTASNSFTDAIALEGLKLVSESLQFVVADGNDLEARSKMALAAYYSGIVLANAGLGVVHGFASPIGGYHDAPHGVICSRLMSPSNVVTVRKLRNEDPDHPALKKYAMTGRLFAGENGESNEYYTDVLLEKIRKFTSDFNIPPLTGIDPVKFQKIIAGTESKNNPVKLNQEELAEILELAIR
jgi:alcohol dehydrogenase class IV